MCNNFDYINFRGIEMVRTETPDYKWKERLLPIYFNV